MIERTQKSLAQFHVDYLLLLVCSGLLLIGYIMVASSSLHLGVKMTGNVMHYPVRQMLHIVVGLVAAGVVASVPMALWEKAGSVLFIGGLLLLLVVLIPGIGVKVNGSVRWLSLGGLRIQVSEIVKFISVIYMAGYVVRHQEDVRQSAYGLLRPLLPFSFACGLLLLEPDFGSAVVILTIAMGMMFLGGARLRQFVILMTLVVLLAALMVWVSPYRVARITAFIDPWADAQNTGFQLVQALISFGRGDVFGVGLGNGIQKLFYLPEAHTDFLFSVLAEELGLLGVTVVIALFTLLLWRAFQIGAMAEKAGRVFSAFVAYGIGIWFGFQSFVNMGVNMGMLPTKGLTLPLMSYGGGSVIVMCAAIAVLFRVNSEITEQLKGEPKGKREWASA